MIPQKIQKQELAGKTKLTAVTIGHGGRRLQFFATLQHDSKGNAILPEATLNKALDTLGCRMRGQTFTHG